MANFHQVQVTPLADRRHCYWCALEQSMVRATQLVSRTSNLTHRRYSDAACDRHAMAWRRVASPTQAWHVGSTAGRSWATRRA
jgi:hypothetical protein